MGVVICPMYSAVLGYAKAVMNFYLAVRADNTGVILTTETRILASDPATRRKFARYWRVIFPGSALIRRMWLRAIKRRAEGLAVQLPR
jgi:hypothetical protein